MYKIYQIGVGESISDIAKMFNVNNDELKKINGIKDNMTLTPGSFIIVPANGNNNYTDYTVQAGDSIYGISKKYNIDVDTLLKLNGLEENDYIYPNQVIKIPNANNVYITKKGDTIDTIVKKSGLTPNEIAKNNSIYLVGDQLIKLN